jgi:Holliday junction resolvasome RuvABC endonuclease subunit
MPIIFGLDPSLRSTGYGIIQVEGRTTRALLGLTESPPPAAIAERGLAMIFTAQRHFRH